LSLARRALKDRFPTPKVPLTALLSNHQVFLPDPVFLLVICLETLRAGSDPTNRRTNSLPCEPLKRSEDTIKMYLQEVGCGDMDLIDLAQDNDRWWALVHAVMYPKFHNIGEFLD